MTVNFWKESHEKHRLECLRADGTKTAAVLESKSLLRHDFLHFLIESEAGLKDSFYARVARGENLEKEYRNELPDPSKELQATEMLAGMLQGAFVKSLPAEEAVAFISEMLPNLGHAIPAYLTPDFYEAVHRKFLWLMKQWEALKTGEKLTLEFKE